MDRLRSFGNICSFTSKVEMPGIQADLIYLRGQAAFHLTVFSAHCWLAAIQWQVAMCSQVSQHGKLLTWKKDLLHLTQWTWAGMKNELCTFGDGRAWVELAPTDLILSFVHSWAIKIRGSDVEHSENWSAKCEILLWFQEICMLLIFFALLQEVNFFSAVFQFCWLFHVLAHP